VSEIPNPANCKGGPGNTCWELMCGPCSEEVSRLRSENERLRDDGCCRQCVRCAEEEHDVELSRLRADGKAKETT
jgi:hypothetical protein